MLFRQAESFSIFITSERWIQLPARLEIFSSLWRIYPVAPPAAATLSP
jgi:hypothetical protein